MHFKRLTKDITKKTFNSNMAASSKNLHDILQRYGDGVGLENVWSSYMLVLMCHEFINKGQTDKGARKPQVSQK